MASNQYDEDVVLQLMNFGYSREEIIQASNRVVNHKDINTIHNELASINHHQCKDDKRTTNAGSNSMLPPPSATKMVYSKSAELHPTKKQKKKKKKKKDANWWIKSDQNKHDPSA
eukprot:246010_1